MDTKEIRGQAKGRRHTT